MENGFILMKDESESVDKEEKEGKNYCNNNEWPVSFPV